ncbi:hypothetical protein COO91_01048 [Nostoc flagelliforme CCNUN1]|uniref:Uncharacterized protein n=1 Tax=Nostoc flagelliforme CCNUN1 TaxID=2038116 RepID=A0A2K8SIR7_9NOSO|nr:hypothetical protein COO91_01048 [Nostoc flagelliforme CCNUN1]
MQCHGSDRHERHARQSDRHERHARQSDRLRHRFTLHQKVESDVQVV